MCQLCKWNTMMLFFYTWEYEYVSCCHHFDNAGNNNNNKNLSTIQFFPPLLSCVIESRLGVLFFKWHCCHRLMNMMIWYNSVYMTEALWVFTLAFMHTYPQKCKSNPAAGDTSESTLVFAKLRCCPIHFYMWHKRHKSPKWTSRVYSYFQPKFNVLHG